MASLLTHQPYIYSKTSLTFSPHRVFRCHRNAETHVFHCSCSGGVRAFSSRRGAILLRMFAIAHPSPTYPYASSDMQADPKVLAAHNA